jgi:hypothetical protein
VLHVLRDSSFAVIDPSRWSRAGGRIQLASDDATSIVPLASPGIALALSGDGSAAFVLHEDLRTLSVIDTVSARVIDTRRLDGERDLMAGPTASGRIVLASSSLDSSLMTISTPPAPALAAGTPPVEEPEPVPPPEPLPPPAPAEPEIGKTAPAVSPEPPVTESPPPAREPEPEAEPAPPAPPDETEAVAGPGLSGSLSGNIKAAKEVLLYGPNNLLRLAARTPVADDGTFRFDLPPPGSYRVIVSAGPEGQIFTNPRFRTIVVEKEGTGSTALDFEIVGEI